VELEVKSAVRCQEWSNESRAEKRVKSGVEGQECSKKSRAQWGVKSGVRNHECSIIRMRSRNPGEINTTSQILSSFLEHNQCSNLLIALRKLEGKWKTGD
jgi:hypothetical protein